MRVCAYSVSLAIVLAALAPQALAVATVEPEWLFAGSIEPGLVRRYGHDHSVLLLPGTWAKTGADVSFSIVSREETLLQMELPYPGNEEAAPPRVPELNLGEGFYQVSIRIGRNITLPNPEAYYAVTGIVVTERDNDACRLELLGQMIDSRYRTGDRLLARFELEHCRDALMPGFAAPPSTLGSRGEFARSVKSCAGSLFHGSMLAQPATARKLKDNRIRGAWVVPDTDAVLPRQAAISQQEPNCADQPADTEGKGWSNWLDCPSGQLMTGVSVIHWRDKSFSASLSPICLMPRRSLPAALPVKDAHGVY